jgi:hypothetical protein
MSSSREWLMSLRVGDVILAPHSGAIEELLVVREVLPRRERAGVVVKRKFLKAPFFLTEYGEHVEFMWSCHWGKSAEDFTKWEVRRAPSEEM